MSITLRPFTGLLAGLFLLATLAAAVPEVLAATARPVAPSGVLERLAAGEPQELLVLFEDGAVEREVASLRQAVGLRRDDSAILGLRAARYEALRQRALSALPPEGFEILHGYSHLPMACVRLRSSAALTRLLARSEVAAVYPNELNFPSLAQSLPLIEQPLTAAVGYGGAGATVAVIDTGCDISRPEFGSCSAPGTPGCRIVAYQNIAVDDGPADWPHGTNVAAIVAAVAPEANIAAVDVFNQGGAYDSDIIAGINWAIAHQADYNIVAINMSLGDSTDHTSPCSNKFSNPYVVPVANAKAAGIITVAASGNGGFTNGLSRPACTTGVVSVGAVYDSNVGGLSWSICTDTTTAADKVACFSNSASFLSVLAPGAIITAGGYSYGGTSQASPHVAGAVAVLRQAFPEDSLDQTIARITLSGVPVTDPRNGITKPRLDLAAAARPTDDAFASSTALGGEAGQVSGTTLLAQKETGEPNHAGNPGGHSVWYTWTAQDSGWVTIDTHGSGFDTLLAIYTGTAVGGLSSVAANDNDGSSGGASGVSFYAVAGTQYEIAVDGSNGAAGGFVLNWSWSASPPPSDDDIPTLPEWGGLLMGLALIGCGAVRGRRTR